MRPGSIPTSLWCGRVAQKPPVEWCARCADACHPPQRGTAEGLPLPGLRPLTEQDQERPLKIVEGGPPLCRVFVLRGKQRGGAADTALPVRGTQAAPGSGAGRRRVPGGGGALPVSGQPPAGAAHGAGGASGAEETSREDLAALLERSRGRSSARCCCSMGSSQTRLTGNRPISCEKLDKNTNYAHNRTIAEIPWRMRL